MGTYHTNVCFHQSNVIIDQKHCLNMGTDDGDSLIQFVLAVPHSCCVTDVTKKKIELDRPWSTTNYSNVFFFIVSTSHLFNLTCVQCHELDTLSALCVMEGLNIHNWTWTWTSLSTAGPSRQSPWEDQLVAANTQNTMNSLNYVHINILCIY